MAVNPAAPTTSGGPAQSSSASSPLTNASARLAPAAAGTRASSTSQPQPDIASNFWSSAWRPSLMSPQTRPNPWRRSPSSIFGSRRSDRRASRASAAVPKGPVTPSAQPALAAERGSGRLLVRPSTVIAITAGPGVSVVSPPTTLSPTCAASSETPRKIPRKASTCQWRGAEMETRPWLGRAPFAARSPRAAASARQPTSSGACQPRSKCTDSTLESLDATVKPPPGSSQAAASSSPGPITSSRAGRSGTRRRTSSASPSWSSLTPPGPL